MTLVWSRYNRWGRRASGNSLEQTRNCSSSELKAILSIYAADHFFCLFYSRVFATDQHELLAPTSERAEHSQLAGRRCSSISIAYLPRLSKSEPVQFAMLAVNPASTYHPADKDSPDSAGSPPPTLTSPARISGLNTFFSRQFAHEGISPQS